MCVAILTFNIKECAPQKIDSVIISRLKNKNAINTELCVFDLDFQFVSASPGKRSKHKNRFLVVALDLAVVQRIFQFILA